MAIQTLSKQTIIIIAAILVLFIMAGGLFTLHVYKFLYEPRFFSEETTFIYIDEGKDVNDLRHQIDSLYPTSVVEDFWFVVEYLDYYPDNIKSGKYAVKPNISLMEFINNLRRGLHTSTRITFNNIRFKEDMARRLSEQLMIGEEDLLYYLNDETFCDSLGFTPQTIVAMFIPNTYEVYWNIPADRLLHRMKREYESFWTDSRKAKAEEIGLTPLEVSILASIVEEETAAADEYPIVAGLYINRLKRNIPLQADPTVKFALGDFSLQRILFVHLEIDSPYNTYKYAGLPPGPLRSPSIRGIDAVLNHTKHNYIYMCAKEDFSGRHNFAVTLSEHNRNANRYRAELNRRNIR